jgi:hypothetical protein
MKQDANKMTTTPTSAKEDPARAAWVLARRELMLFGVLAVIALGFSLLH